MYIYISVCTSICLSIYLYIYLYIRMYIRTSRWMARWIGAPVYVGPHALRRRSICAADGDTVVTRIRFDPTAAPAGTSSTRCEYSQYPV